MAKHASNDRKRTTKGSARKDANYVRVNASGRTKHARSDQPSAPSGKPVMVKSKASRSASKANPLAAFARTTMGKWACAFVALALVVGVGNAIGGTDVSSDATTHALVTTGGASQDSVMVAVDDAAEEAAKAVTKAGADVKAEAESQAKAQAEEKAAAEAELNAKAESEAQARAQQEQFQHAASVAASSTPQVSESNAARSSSGTSNGGGSAAPAPSSSGDGNVYVAASGEGERYHSRPVCGRMKSSISMSLSEAKSRGLTACGTCY